MPVNTVKKISTNATECVISSAPPPGVTPVGSARWRGWRSPRRLNDAVLAMLVERFDGRMLTWQVATEGLALAAFEIKQTALWRRPGWPQEGHVQA